MYDFRNRIKLINDGQFLFCDDQSIENKILYFTFNTYILNGTISYFNHVQNNVFFIKENRKLPQYMINNLINYEYLVSYVEVDKI